ncbi:MAG TPA: sensor histidine kinase [Jatrophihabitans sp.]|nr:sensor histidine kinase [Jatrophihabitans sp.]
MSIDALAQPERSSSTADADHRDPAQAQPGWLTVVVAATGRSIGSSRPISLRRMVIMLTTAGVLLLCLVAVAGSLLSRQIAGSQAVREVAQTTDLLAESVLQPSLTNPMATDPKAAAALDPLVRDRILSSSLLRVKLWSPAGKIIYSDETQLVGRSFDLDEGARAALSSPRTQAEITDLSRPENAFERDQAKLLEVYRPVWTPDGHELLFEMYFRYDAVTDRSSELWHGFVGITLSSVGLLFLLLMPVMWALLRRTRQAQLQREAMMQRALDASTEERQRIAAALHDGIVQELAATSFGLAAAAETARAASQPGLADQLRSAATTVRASLGGLRSLVVDLYPASLRSAGLPAALRDLAATPISRGPQVIVDIDDTAAAELSPDQQQATYRIAQECLRNTVKHAEADTAQISLRADGDGVCLLVSDDGVGFDPASRPAQHLGLSLMRDVATAIGGQLEVRTAPGTGTGWRLWVRTR